MQYLPKDNTQYQLREYWDERYSKEAEGTMFDWFKKWSDLEHLVGPLIPNKDSRILMLGCGNSTLSEDMYAAGYHNIVNVDYSSIVIDKMRERHADKPSMTWLEMDIKDLKFDNESFDVAIDKGTMDALMCDKGDVWDPSEEVIKNCKEEVDEVVRILRKPNGQFIYMTFGQPHFRRRHLQREGWDLEVKTMGEAFHYFLYRMSVKNSEENAEK